MTALTVDGAGDNREAPAWPGWEPPVVAVRLWVELQRQVAAMGRAPACARDPESWWAGRSMVDAPRVEAARQGCEWCPARAACAAYAIAAEEPAGVWGGLTADYRVALRAVGRAS